MHLCALCCILYTEAREKPEPTHKTHKMKKYKEYEDTSAECKERLQWFAQYRDVQEYGEYNMITQAPEAREDAGLSKKQYYHVIENYAELKEQWEQIWEPFMAKRIKLHRENQA